MGLYGSVYQLVVMHITDSAVVHHSIFGHIDSSVRRGSKVYLHLTIRFTCMPIYTLYYKVDKTWYLCCCLLMSNIPLNVNFKPEKTPFAQSIEPLLEHLRRVMDKSALSKVTRLFLVGAFSECRYLQERVRAAFDKSLQVAANRRKRAKMLFRLT